MNKITTISSMVALAIGLGACQSGKNDISLQPVVAYKSEQVSKQITNIPDWYQLLGIFSIYCVIAMSVFYIGLWIASRYMSPGRS